eukprot:g28809.t2
MSGVQADGPQREDPAGPALADLEHIKAAARLLEMVLRKPVLKHYSCGLSAWRCGKGELERGKRQECISATSAVRTLKRTAKNEEVPAQALALTRIVEVLRAKIAIQSTRVLECWRVKTVMLASWERSQEIFANELQVLRAEDADEDVSKNLMVWAETAAVRARTCALLGGFALLKRLGSLRVGGALQHWKALSALRQRKDPGLRNLARSLDHVVRTRLALAWARWQGWNQIRLSQWCHEQVQPEVEHLHGTPSSVSRRRGAQSPAAGGRSRVAARAEDLLRLKVRLAWRADFVQRCGLLKNEADRKRPTAEEVWMLRLDRGAACLLEYTLASAYRAQLRYAFNAMLAWATEMPSRRPMQSGLALRQKKASLCPVLCMPGVPLPSCLPLPPAWIEDFGIDASVLPNELLNVVEQLGMHQLLPNVSLSAGDTYRGPVSMLRRAFEATESLGSLTVVLAIMDHWQRVGWRCWCWCWVQLRMLAQRIVEQCHAKTRPLPNGALPEAPIGRGGKKERMTPRLDRVERS